MILELGRLISNLIEDLLFGPVLIELCVTRIFMKVLIGQLLPLEPMHGKLIGFQSEGENEKARQQQAQFRRRTETVS